MLKKDFIDFIRDQNKNLASLNRYTDTKGDVLDRIAKLSEETGEFAGVSLTAIGSASNRKVKAFKKEQLIEEFGDVIITACLLADKLGLDMDEALEIRKKEIEDRWK